MGADISSELEHQVPRPEVVLRDTSRNLQPIIPELLRTKLDVDMEKVEDSYRKRVRDDILDVEIEFLRKRRDYNDVIFNATKDIAVPKKKQQQQQSSSSMAIDSKSLKDTGNEADTSALTGDSENGSISPQMEQKTRQPTAAAASAIFKYMRYGPSKTEGNIAEGAQSIKTVKVIFDHL